MDLYSLFINLEQRIMTANEIICVLVLSGIGIIFMRFIAIVIDQEEKKTRAENKLFFTQLEKNLLDYFIFLGYTEMEVNRDWIVLYGPFKEKAMLDKAFHLFEEITERTDIQELLDGVENENL